MNELPNESLLRGTIDYESILRESGDRPLEEKIVFLFEELPYAWRDGYIEMTLRVTNIVRIQCGSFTYIFDDFSSLEASGVVPPHPVEEARLVAVYGRSVPRQRKRDDSRLKGWVGPTEQMYGAKWDKGHFIAHSIGGSVDRAELNVFVQRRDLNRGWSTEGRRYREMETYCTLNPSTFCFSRPLYLDETAKPAYIEFGILRSNSELWLECFDNRVR